MKLVENWQQAPRMYVVQVLAVIAIVQAVWAELPPEIVAKLPAGFVHYVTAALAVGGIVARVIKQFYAQQGQQDEQWPVTHPEDPTKDAHQ
jgi:hypothetical protein